MSTKMSDAEELMRKVSAAFEKGDLQPLLDSLHPDIVWKAASTQAGLFRFSGSHHQRAGVRDVTSQIAMDYTFYHFQPREIVASGDVVWGLFDAEIGYKPMAGRDTSRHVNLEIAIRWQLQDGKIIQHQAFFDTASLLSQQGQAIELLP
jgi:ketosteroid isomerase-like protein